MDLKKFNETLNQVFLEVLEQYAFLMPEPLSLEQETDASAFAGEPYLEIDMAVSGTLNGEFIMLLPRKTCTEIEENLVGNEPGAACELDTDADGANEILNIIGGAVLSHVIGEHGSFDISIPKSKTFDVNNWDHLSQLKYVSGFVVDGSPVFLFFDGPKEAIAIKSVGG
jgi:hypothetical protein